MHYGGGRVRVPIARRGRWTKWRRNGHSARNVFFPQLSLVLLACSLLLSSSRCFALTIVLSDFDNSIVETRQSRGGTFQTTFRLFRIEHRSTVLQKEPEGPKYIDVTPIEFHRLKGLLGKGNRDFGAVGMKVTLNSGQVISPGNYMVVDPDTFERFYSAKGRNYLLEDFKAAEERDPAGNWRGEYWNKMTAILEDAKSARGFGIITARAHDLKDWKELFGYLKTSGYIKHLPNFNLFHNVSRPEYDRFGIRGDISARKVALLRETALRLGRAPLAAEDQRLDPSGKGRGAFHLLVFADDDQRTVELAARAMSELAQGKQVPVKFALINLGTESEVKSSQRPRYAIVENDGTFRKASATEMLGEPAQMSDEQANVLLQTVSSRCERLLKGDN